MPQGPELLAYRCECAAERAAQEEMDGEEERGAAAEQARKREAMAGIESRLPAMPRAPLRRSRKGGGSQEAKGLNRERERERAGPKPHRAKKGTSKKRDMPW